MSYFEPDDAGITELMNDPESLAVLDEAATAMMGEAVQSTPRSSDPRRGHFADHYVTDKAQPTATGGEAGVRNTDASFFHLINFGSVHNAGAHPMERGARAAGLIWQDR